MKTVNSRTLIKFQIFLEMFGLVIKQSGSTWRDQTFLVSLFGGTGPSLSCPLWTIPTSLPRSQPSLVLLPKQDKTVEKFFLQRLRAPSAGSRPPPSGLSRIWAFPARHLGTTSSIFDLWSRSWGVARLLGLREVPLRPRFSEGVV